MCKHKTSFWSVNSKTRQLEVNSISIGHSTCWGVTEILNIPRYHLTTYFNFDIDNANANANRFIGHRNFKPPPLPLSQQLQTIPVWIELSIHKKN